MKMNQTPKAVLFDFDGVIVDSENLHIAAWEQTFERIGWEIPPEACVRSAQVDDETFFHEILRSKGVQDGAVAGWVAQKQAIAKAMRTNHNPRVFEGVSELIEKLKDLAILGVVTTSRREDVLATLEQMNVLQEFRLIVSKDDVTSRKPHPESYQKALEQLGFHSSEVVALEDSETGLLSAQGAGIRCVVVGAYRPQEPWASGAPFLDHLEDLDEVMKVLGFSGSENQV